MTPKDVIAQAEIKFLELWVYEGMDYPENQDQAFEKFKSFLSSYTKDLLQSVVEDFRHEIEMSNPSILIIRQKLLALSDIINNIK